MPGRFYVYALFRETGIPFYIGMGQAQRMLSHEKRCYKLETHKDRLIANLLLSRADVPKVVIRSGLSREEAFDIEKAFISALGREPVGPLINQTSGGDGVPDIAPEKRILMNQKVSLKLRGRQRDPSVGEKISLTKKLQSEVTGAQSRARWTKYSKSERVAMVPNNRGRVRTPEQRAAMAERAREQWARRRGENNARQKG